MCPFTLCVLSYHALLPFIYWFVLLNFPPSLPFSFPSLFIPIIYIHLGSEPSRAFLDCTPNTSLVSLPPSTSCLCLTPVCLLLLCLCVYLSCVVLVYVFFVLIYQSCVLCSSLETPGGIPFEGRVVSGFRYSHSIFFSFVVSAQVECSFTHHALLSHVFLSRAWSLCSLVRCSCVLCSTQDLFELPWLFCIWVLFAKNLTECL